MRSIALVMMLFATISLSIPSSVGANVHKCSRPWPLTDAKSDVALDLEALAVVNKELLTNTGAAHLVEMQLAENYEAYSPDGPDDMAVEQGNIRIEATFESESITLKLDSGCSSVILVPRQEKNAGTFLNSAGTILNRGDELEKNCEVTFQPAAGFSGEAVFIYDSKSNANLTNNAVVVQVVPCNSNPVASDDHVDGMSGRIHQ